MEADGCTGSEMTVDGGVTRKMVYPEEEGPEPLAQDVRGDAGGGGRGAGSVE